MGYSITKEIGSRVLEVDKDKVEFRGISISLDDNGGVMLGRQEIYKGRDEDARRYYDRLKAAVEKGNYKLTIYPSLYTAIEIIE